MYVEVIVPRHLTYYIEDYTLDKWMELKDLEKWDIIDGSNAELINDETEIYNGVIEYEGDYN